MERDEYGWDELGKDLAFLTPLTLMQTHHLLWPLQHRSDAPDAPAVHPYDLCRPLVDLLTADGDYRIIGRALQRLIVPAPEDALSAAEHLSVAQDAIAVLEHVVTELTAIRADLKNCFQDTMGLMYERGPNGLRLREYVTEADTNGPSDQCDDRIQAARGRVTELLDLLDPLEPTGQEAK